MAWFPFVLRSTYDAMTADRDKWQLTGTAWEKAWLLAHDHNVALTAAMISMRRDGFVGTLKSPVAAPVPEPMPPALAGLGAGDRKMVGGIVAQLRTELPNATDAELYDHARELLGGS